eukprot:9468225-Pyramimonas_sp.AAC.1
MRPLQLPTCLRRLHGASLADLMGPLVEPVLSPNQAAKRGGQCGPNITKVTQHLGSLPKPPAEPGPAWPALLGRHREAVDEFVDRAATVVGNAPCTAVILCDQNNIGF